MQPKPWSVSSLDNFTTCARKYHEEAILKTVPKVDTPAQAAGLRAHKAFEMRLAVKDPLPAYLAHHEPVVAEIEAGPGVIWTERKVGISLKMQPCDFFDPDVWWRGAIDVYKKRPDGTALVVDWKNGKEHSKMRQLWLYALWAFLDGCHTVELFYFWLPTQRRTRIVMPRQQMPTILRGLMPDLASYKEAFRDDVWPPKPSGLCKAHCGVTGCEYHGVGAGRRY